MSIEISFGSKARGDNDYISDVDILKVCNFEDELYKNENNIHFYTKKRLKKLKEVESLFLVHLKNEGKIVSDESDWMKLFLKDIPNFVSKEKDIHLVKRYLSILLSIKPTNTQILWWFDCLYVFLRDYYIKINSTYNYYSFSPHSFGKLKNNDIKLDLTNEILQLRGYKSTYRNKLNIENKIEENYIIEIKNKISLALGISIDNYSLIDIFMKNDNNTESYFRLRLLEGLYLNNEIKIKDNILLKFIESPHLYSWEIKRLDFNSKIEVL